MPIFRGPIFWAVAIAVAAAAQAEDGDPLMEPPAPFLESASYYTASYYDASNYSSSNYSASNFGAFSFVSDTTVDLPSVAAQPGCDAIADGTSCCGNGPLWTAQAGAVILSRTSRSAILVRDAVTGDPLINARDLGTPWAAGPDISVQRWFDSGSSLQFRFFDVDGLSSHTSFATTPFIILPTVPPLFGFGLTNMAPTYATRIYSTELNLQRPAASWLSWLVGFRWVELYENLDLHFTAPLATGDLRFQTANRLYGGQAGASALLWNRGALRVDSVLKAGLYGNAASNQFLLTQSIGPAFRAADQRGQVAFLGDISIVGVYQWTDNIALRGGYQLLWLDGVALAPDQIAATHAITANGIDTTGDSFYHGALLGLEVAW